MRPLALSAGSGNANRKQIEVGILGAGIAGLVAASKLQRVRYGVLVFEADN